MLLSCRSSLYTHISDIVHTFAHSVRWLFTLLTVSFDAQMFLNFDDLSFEVQIIYLFSFVMCPSGVISNRSSLSPKSWSFAPGFSPKNFIVLFTFLCPLVHFFFGVCFLPCCAACSILVPQPRIKLVPPAVEISLNYWVAREVLLANFWAFKIYFQ